MADNLSPGVVDTEGCRLHYWTTGSSGHPDPSDRRLITFVPGGFGHAAQFFPIMTALASEHFTCVSFDRRQMSASTVSGPAQKLSFTQQARDVRAVIRAVGFDTSIIFCSSAGGLFGIQLALDFPHMVDHLLLYETPLFGLLPDASALYD
jgi:pimeloyl-ACP methyl ester carboxylesterase